LAVEGDKGVSLPVCRELMNVQLHLVAAMLDAASVSLTENWKYEADEKAKGWCFFCHRKCGKSNPKYSLFSLDTLLDDTSEQCPFLCLCTRATLQVCNIGDRLQATCGRFG